VAFAPVFIALIRSRSDDSDAPSSTFTRRPLTQNSPGRWSGAAASAIVALASLSAVASESTSV
jgi:hypothetical protein